MTSLLLLSAAVVVAVSALPRHVPSRWSARLLASLSLAAGCLGGGLLTDSLTGTTACVAAAETPSVEKPVAEKTDAASVAPAPEAKAPEAKAPEAKAPEAKAPEAKAPEAKAPEAKAPEAKPESGATAASPAKEPAADPSKEPVKIITNVQYLAKDRPDWLEKKPFSEGATMRVAVKAGPYYRMRQCLADLDDELRSATAEFIADDLGSTRAAGLIRYNVSEIKNRLVKATFEEQLTTSVGPMNQAHALLVFDNSFRKEIEQRWKQIKSLSRLLQVGIGSGVVLLMLATMFGYFRLDTATRGYYTGRLQFMAAAAILTLVAASVMLIKWIPWL
jgi:hypothetical protein